MRRPKHHIGTKVSREWMDRMDAERRAAITPEQHAEMERATKQHAANVAAGLNCATCGKPCQFAGKNIAACADYQ